MIPLTDVTKFSNVLYSCGALNAARVRSLFQKYGFRSLIGLQHAAESSYEDLSEVCNDLGINWANHPVTGATWNSTAVRSIIDVMKTAPKPLLVICASNIRSAALAASYMVLVEGQKLDDLQLNPAQLSLVQRALS